MDEHEEAEFELIELGQEVEELRLKAVEVYTRVCEALGKYETNYALYLSVLYETKGIEAALRAATQLLLWEEWMHG